MRTFLLLKLLIKVISEGKKTFDFFQAIYHETNGLKAGFKTKSERISVFRFRQLFADQGETCGYSGSFILDTPPKSNNHEGLRENRTGTRQHFLHSNVFDSFSLKLQKMLLKCDQNRKSKE